MTYYEKHKGEIKMRVRKRYHTNAIAINEKRRTEWHTSGKRRIQQNNYRKSVRQRVFQRLGGARCVYCGCDDIRFLEVNHKNGGGNKTDFKSKAGGLGCGRGWTFYGNILNGKRRIDDLEVACRVCNALHYLKVKFGSEATTNFRVNWMVFRLVKDKHQTEL